MTVGELIDILNKFNRGDDVLVCGATINTILCSEAGFLSLDNGRFDPDDIIMGESIYWEAE